MLKVASSWSPDTSRTGPCCASPWSGIVRTDGRLDLGDLTATPLPALTVLDGVLDGAGLDASDLNLDVTDDMFLGYE